ncbi:MAG: tyrosine-type recombinase/integrase [Deltaproteobacteria bacterium]|nr:tyrosine-type recombinase/integrase [Deltaproteobacteria bacterium]
MGLYKRGSVWWMGFTHHGEQLRRSTETENKKLAIRIFDKLKGEIAEGKWFPHLEGEDKTFNELMDRYMKEYSAICKAPSSHLRDKGLEKHLRSFFGDSLLTQIAPNMISEYKLRRRADGVSPRTINYELTLMGHAFNLAMKEWEWVKDNPVMRVRKERVNNKVERWLSLDEEQKLLVASPLWLREIITFAIHTGLRQGEIMDLKWSQIDFTRKTLIITEQKNRSVDTLPLNATAFDVLAEKVPCVLDTDKRVFVNHLGNRIGSSVLIRAFHLAEKKAGINKLRFHDLRHTFATRLIQNGVDLFTVQKLGRWKNTSMVTRYAHHCSESLRAGIEVMDSLKPPVITKLSQSQKNRVTDRLCGL